MPTSFISMNPESENCTRGNPPSIHVDRKPLKMASIASELVETGQTETGALSIVKLGMNEK